MFGSKFLASLTSIEIPCTCNYQSNADTGSIDDESCSPEVENDESAKPSNAFSRLDDAVVIEGYVSKVGDGVGRSDNERQFVYCNGRPVDLPKLVKAANEVVKLFYSIFVSYLSVGMAKV